MLHKTTLRTLRIILGIAILAILVIKIDIRDVVHALTQFKLWFFIPLTILSACQFLLGAYGIHLLLHAVKSGLSFRDVLRYYLLSSAVGTIMPGKVGELSLVYFLKKRGRPAGEVAALVVIDLLITIAALIAFAGVGLLLFLDLRTALQIAGISVFGLLTALVLLTSQRAHKLLRAILPAWITHNMKGFSKTVRELWNNQKRYLGYNLLTTILKWIFTFTSFYVAFSGMGARLPLISFLLLAVVMLLSFVPITISGLGVREAAGVYLFTKVGGAPAVVLSVFLLMVFLKYLSALFILFGVSERAFGWIGSRRNA